MPKTFDSWKSVLTAVCGYMHPKLIVEWGPGLSTDFFSSFTDADVYTWEHDKSYYDKVNSKFKDNSRIHVNLGIFMSKDLKMYGKRSPYIAAPLLFVEPNTVDLAFVDGRMRCDCLIMAKYLIKEKGVVVLHDAYRAYSIGKSVYTHTYLDEDNGTQLFCKDKKVLDSIVNRIGCR